MRLLTAALLLVALSGTALAQLSGTKTIGGGGDYASIDAAIVDLVRNGVSAPVTFLIANGTYTAPAGGYTLPAVAGMGPQRDGSINTVTFKPASGATVEISGSTNDGTAIFAFDDGDYYIIDGSNTAGGTSRNMLLRQLSTTYAATIWMRNDADFNVVKNTTLQSQNGTGGLNLALGGVTVFIGQSTALSGNDSNLIENNLVGDPSGTYRGFRAIYCYGATPTVVNVGTRIIGNDVVNFGNLQVNTFGIFLSYHNIGAIVRGNIVRMTTATGTVFSQVYGLYANEEWLSPSGNSTNSVFEGNRVYGLQTAQTSELIYGLAYFGANNTVGSNVRIANNMFANDRGTTSTSYYAMYIGATNTTSTINIDHNSVYIAGSGSSYYGTFVSNDGRATINHRNNAYYAPWTGGGTVLYLTSTTLVTTNNNLYEIAGSANIVYYGGAFYNTLSAYRTAAAPNESASVSGNPRFASPNVGDLHISTTLPTPVESMGAPLTSVPADFDNQLRSTTRPDIGADEGNFNGGGIQVVRPNGGEVYLGGTSVSWSFTINRPMPVRIEYTLNNGASWTAIGTFNLPVAGSWSLGFTVPDIATTGGRLRVNNTANVIEGDTSDAPFTIVQPGLTLVSPNGGESLFQGDVVPIRWTATDMLSDSRVALDYSTNNGTSWTTIVTDLPTPNAPTVNSYNWTVPAVATTQALVRVRMIGRNVSDVSNATFAIRKSMNLLSPNGGEQWFVGETQWIRWAVNRVPKLDIEYSTDNGTSWITLARSIRSFNDSFRVVVPNTPTSQALVRIANSDAPSFNERSAATFSILSEAVELITPNGGEKYEQSQPVTVLWESYITESQLRLEYTSDGISWTTIATGISSGSERYTFTPPAFPTKHARVRLTVEGRPMLSDASDRAFEIMEAPGIAIFTPSQGEEINAGSSYEITWGATRVSMVNIDYSPNGGTTWTRVASGLQALNGTYTWTVPTTLTPSGKIRISSTTGQIVAETGLFSIVTPPPATPTVRLLRPNGGERFTSGEPITVAWTSTLTATVQLEYSSDAGASWRTVPGAGSLPATPASFVWPAPAPGDYRVRVRGNGIFDDSDDDFQVVRAIVPGITVLSPNGGEELMVDSAMTIAWLARDVTANVDVELSTDDGATWTPVGSAAAAAGSLNWTVPSSPTTTALVRVIGGGVGDTSDATFTIATRPVASVTLLSPNTSGTSWTEGDSVTITWQSTDVSAVDITLSTDGGTTWGTTIAQNVDATAGSQGWRVPRILPTASNTIRVRIAAAGATTPADTSDESFSYQPLVASVDIAATTGGSTFAGLYPNPAAGATELRWSQLAGGTVRLAIYAADGRLVATDDLGHRAPGANTATIDASALASGVYHVELRIGTAALRGSLRVAR